MTALAGALGRPICVISLSSKGMSDESLRGLLNSAAARCMLLLEVGSSIACVLPAVGWGDMACCSRGWPRVLGSHGLPSILPARHPLQRGHPPLCEVGRRQGM